MKLYIYMLVCIFLVLSLPIVCLQECVAVIGTNALTQQPSDSLQKHLYVPVPAQNYSFAEIKNAYLRHCYFLKTYEMTPAQIDGLLAVKWDQIVNALLSLEKDDEIVLKLWQKYKNKRCWDFGWKDDCEEKLKLKLRERSEYKRLQELRSIYSESAIPSAYVSEFHELACKNRIEALQESYKRNFKQEVKRYALDEMTSGMMLAHGLDRNKFSKLKGTSYQHCLYKEVIDIYTQVAELMLGVGFNGSVLLPYVMSFSAISCDAIEGELFKVAIALNDISAFLVQFSRGVCAGVLASVEDNYHMLIHPVQTTEQLELLANRLLTAMVDVVSLHRCNACNCIQTFYSVTQQYVEVSELIGYGFRQLDGWWQNSSVEQKSKTFSQVVSDCILPQKLCTIGAKFCSMLVSRAKSCRSISGVSYIAEELGLLGDELLSAEWLVDVNCEQKVLAREGVESYKPLHPYKILPFEMVLQRIRDFKGVIPFAEKELLQSLKHHLERALKQANKRVSKKVIQQYKKVIKEFQGKQVEVISNLEHIGNFEFFLERSAKYQGYRVKIMGGHMSGSVKELEKVGLARVKEEKMLINGFKQFIYEDLVTGKLVTKTEFPSQWDIKKIMDKTFEAYDSCKQEILKKDNRLVRKGVTSEGIILDLVLDQYFEREVVMQFGMPASEVYSLSRQELLDVLSQYNQRMVKSMFAKYENKVKLITVYLE